MSEEEDLFAEAMGWVRPLAESNKINPEPKAKRRAAVRPARSARIVEPRMGHAPEAGDEPWRLVASGVSRERLKRLAAGRPPVEATIDLHGETRDAALTLLARHLSDAIGDGRRVLCIIHGRGLHSDGKPVLKEAVYRWLREGPFASAVLAAIPEPGSGGGACLVLLRRQGD